MRMDNDPFEIIDEIEARSRALENSRPFDVHTWSDHPEVDAFVDPIYNAHFYGRKQDIRKKHLKVLLLDLYISWNSDPEAYVAISRNSNDYKAGSRYNALHISKLTIDVLDALVDANLVEQNIGFYDRSRNMGKTTRIRPTGELIKLFEDAKFGPMDIGYPPDTETVIIRDRDPDDLRAKEIEYQDTDETRRMSAMLLRYNALLQSTFIDIPTLETPWIGGDENDQTKGVLVSQDLRAKFVRRIFNRGSFEYGGRFYGGWWQRCPKEWRAKIFINDKPTTEIDYTGLHLVLLYAWQGLSYWDEVGGDPYAVELPQWLRRAAGSRPIIKSLTLMTLNAASPKVAFRAFRDKAAPGSWEKGLTDDQLHELLSAIEVKHPLIADMLNSDMGVRLMNWDSRITEIILDHFTAKSVCVLPIHDSYIVPYGWEDELTKVMRRAFEKVTEIYMPSAEEGSIKEVGERVEHLEAALNTWMPYEGLLWQEEAERELIKRRYPKNTGRYMRNRERFKGCKSNK